jgi:hypothetical protein
VRAVIRAKRTRLLALICVLAAAPGAVLAQTADDQGRKVEKHRLDELKAMRREMLRTMQDFDARIKKLEAEMRTQAAQEKPATGKPAVVMPTAAKQAAEDSGTKNAAAKKPVAVADDTTEQIRVSAPYGGASMPDRYPPPPAGEEDTWGKYQPGRGFIAVRSKDGELAFSIISYVRYLNQLGLSPTYTDAFGRKFTVQRRQDVLLNKINFSAKGWLFDPNFSYRVWVWTQNAAMGDPAQVVVAGHMGYHFDDLLNLYGGVAPLPATRSLNWTYPNWLKMDNRTIADEFFRGSYTFGFWADGNLTDNLQYRAMIANNLSALGIDAAQLSARFSTYSVALWWMPTTGEFGPGLGFGDYAFHDKLATMFGIHYTQSPENKQEQPGVNEFENSQIRLSDGTLVFGANPFNNGTQINDATYKMADANAGVKYRGFSLEGEYYARWVGDFNATGPLPVNHLFDQGFQVQASAMLIPKQLQLYSAGSKILGQYGNPWDFSMGLNWYPFSRPEVHINTQGVYLYRSPVGGPSYPYVVGGTGWFTNTDFIITF